MKKIGILFGQENTFPQAFVDRVNQKAPKGITAEFVRIDKVIQAEPLDYAVIIDCISQYVPFYRASLKNAAICGTAVINNPFWESAGEKFFNNTLAVKIGIPVPKTVILPSRELPDNTTSASFRNLAYPLHWKAIFDYVGFPALMKPFDGKGWKDVYKIESKEDFFNKHNRTKQQVMMLQEEIVFDDYVRCYCIGGKHVRIMQYHPDSPNRLHGNNTVAPQILATVKDYVIKLNQYLGYDFNAIDFGIRSGIAYAIDFCNGVPDADIKSIGTENFEWMVETAAGYAIERAKQQQPDMDNLTWGQFVKASAAGLQLVVTPAKKAAKADVVQPEVKADKKTKKAKPKADKEVKPKEVKAKKIAKNSKP